MLTKNAEEQIRGFTQPQKQRYKQYLSSLSTDRENVLFDGNIEEVILEYGRDTKNIEEGLNLLRGIGFTQAHYQYSYLETGIKRFQEENHPSFAWNRNFKTAKQIILDEFNTTRLVALRYDSKDAILNAIPKLDTHAGFSFLLTGKRTKGEYVEDVFSDYTAAEQNALRDGSFNKPIMVGSRTASKKFMNEEGEFSGQFECATRLISMIDLMVILAESKTARPFQNEMGTRSWYAGGKDDGVISMALSKLRYKYPFHTTIDYSAYDQSISDWLIRESFDIVKAVFSQDAQFDEKLFNIMREDFISKVFLDGEGELRFSNKGVPSGSMFTQIIDSIANRLIIETYFQAFPEMGPYDCMIMGDDNIIFTNTQIDLKHLSSYILQNFGVVAHPDKCTQGVSSEDPEFLSRVWTRNGVWRNPNELLAKLCYPERFRDYNFADPRIIVWAYVDSFPRGMRELIDVDKFLSEVRLNVTDLRSNAKWLDGLMKYKFTYLGDW